jgi:hypothetical protein
MTETSKPKSRRELMAGEITGRVRSAVEEEFETASLSEGDRTHITGEILSGTSRILDALSVSEMESEAGLFSYILSARADTRKLLRERRC